MKYTRNMIGAATFASFLLAGSAYADVCDTPSKLGDLGSFPGEVITMQGSMLGTDQEMLEAYKIIARTEGICSALEPMAAAAEVIFRQAKDKPKDYIICLSLCGRGEKDLDTIQEHIGKDFEWKT